MDTRRRENRLKLHLLASLAMSERALARLLVQTVDALEATCPRRQVAAEDAARQERYASGSAGRALSGEATLALSGARPDDAAPTAVTADLRRLERRLAAISRSQAALYTAVSGIRVRQLRRSPPGPIWHPGRTDTSRSRPARK
jgi:mevalonate pyrophosphate decarboxylase